MKHSLDTKHLISLEKISIADIDKIIDVGFIFRNILERPIKKVPTLMGKNIVNIFFENSTRTRISFELAEKRLSADVTNFSSSSSSVNKGESLKDTVQNLHAMKLFFNQDNEKEADIDYEVILAGIITFKHLKKETLKKVNLDLKKLFEKGKQLDFDIRLMDALERILTPFGL